MQEPPEMQVQSLGWEDPGRRAWQPTPVFLPGEPHGDRSLVGYSPWGRKEPVTTERLTQVPSRSIHVVTNGKNFLSLNNIPFRAPQVVLVVKNPPASAGDKRGEGSVPWSGRSPGGWQRTPVFLPEESP